MENLTKLMSHLGATALSKQELKSIVGGYASFTCYCTGWEDQPFQVEADNIGDALDSVNCGGVGHTCNGN